MMWRQPSAPRHGEPAKGGGTPAAHGNRLPLSRASRQVTRLANHRDGQPSVQSEVGLLAYALTATVRFEISKGFNVSPFPLVTSPHGLLPEER